MGAGSAAASKSKRGRTGAMAAGLIMAVAALFMAPMSLREFCILVNRHDFVLDELQVDYFREASGGDSSAWLEGHLVSTGEHYAPDYVSIVGLDRLQKLSQENKVVGYRVPVRYLPKRGGFWASVDRINQFRVQTLEDFDQGFPAGLVTANLVIAMASILLIRRGAR